MKAFRAYFGDGEFLNDYVYIRDETMAGARKQAQEYRRAWKLSERLTKLVEVPIIDVFGRYDNGIYIQCGKGRGDSICRGFKMDDTVQEVYDFIQECIRFQDRAVKGGERCAR